MNINKPMTTVLTVAAIALLSTSQVMAQDVSAEYARPQTLSSPSPSTSTSSNTRADVKAAYLAFRATGEPSVFSREASNRTQSVVTAVTRATVKAETLRALQNGEVVSRGEIYSVRAHNTTRATQLAGLHR
jgi:hypothetical protein